ncbi:MAG TPA: thioesterase domain-containing protein, partial [Longimicrobiales bacterium]|nr:thioesterase domain-containing protein [Longimicrobiales bacterium]
GKIDRRALAALDVGQRPELVPPRNAFEEAVADIWAQILGVERVGIRDDFFELGGHSLLAVRMLAEVERVRGRRVPLATLFEHATIESLARHLASSAHAEGEPGVVVLQDGAPGRPFAFVHGDIYGGGWYCRRLAPLLGNAPLIVLPTLYPDRLGVPATIEAMATVHLAELRRVQPKGPYRLGGYCHGGLIALEMARRLQADGETVERLVLVDSTGMNARFHALAPLLDGVTRRLRPEARIEWRADALAQLRYYSWRLRSVRRMPNGARLRWLAGVLRRRLGDGQRADAGRAATPTPPTARAVLEVDDPAAVLGGEGPASRLREEVLHHVWRAQGAYVPRRFRGPIDLVWSRQLWATAGADPTRGWSAVSPAVRAFGLDATHINLVAYHNLPALAERIRACLDAAEATP